MNEDEVREIAREAAREAIREMMLTMGMDVSSPAAMIEMQKDFQAVRGWRVSVVAVKAHAIVTAVGVVTVGVLAMIAMNFRQ